MTPATIMALRKALSEVSPSIAAAEIGRAWVARYGAAKARTMADAVVLSVRRESGDDAMKERHKYDQHMLARWGKP